MLTIDEKLKLAEWFCKYNPNIALTGSLMMYILTKDTGDYPFDREPEDIDFIVDYMQLCSDDLWDREFVIPPFSINVEKTREVDNYPVMKRIYYKGTKIEFLYGSQYRTRFYKTKHNNKKYEFSLGLPVDLYAAKQMYLLEDKNEEYIEKTRKDLNALDTWFSKNPEIVFENYARILHGYFDNLYTGVYDSYCDSGLSDYYRDLPLKNKLIERFKNSEFESEYDIVALADNIANFRKNDTGRDFAEKYLEPLVYNINDEEIHSCFEYLKNYVIDDTPKDEFPNTSHLNEKLKKIYTALFGDDDLDDFFYMLSHY